jgi:hypothetical protein
MTLACGFLCVRTADATTIRITDLGEGPTTTVEVDGTLVSVGTEELSVSLTNSTVIQTEPRSVLLQAAPRRRSTS